MEGILKELGLEDYVIQSFQVNEVKPEDVAAISESEFIALGVKRIGDRARLREKCRELLAERPSTSSANSSRPVLSFRDFQSFRSEKEKDRQSTFTKKKVKQMERKVKITVGLMRLVDRALKVVRGTTLAVEVLTNSTYAETCKLASSKHLANDRSLPREAYVLLYKDGAQAVHIPGDEAIPFTVQGYRDFLGKPYQKVTLYVCPEQEYTTVSDDSDSELPAGLFAACSSVEKEPDDAGHLEQLSNMEAGRVSTSEIEVKPIVTFIDAGTPTVQIRQPLDDATLPDLTPAAERSSQVTEAYDNFIDITDDYVTPSSSEEQEQISIAAERSLMDVSPSALPDLLTAFQTKTLTGQRSQIVIYRRKILASTMRATSEEGFSFMNELNVHFSGEDAQDDGGPSREYLRLLMKCVTQELGVFQGPTDSLCFVHDHANLEAKKYFHAGQLLAWSILHEGPGLHSMSPDLYALMISPENEISASRVKEVICCNDTKKIVDSISAAEDDVAFQQVVEQHGNWIADRGINSIWQARPADKERIIRRLLMEGLFYKTRVEIDEFIDGMNSIGGFWDDCVKPNSWACRQLFVNSIEPLTSQTFRKLCAIDWSPAGSNQRAKEEDTIYAWELFLVELQNGCQDMGLSDLLIFITGADRQPAQGFQQQISIRFYDMEWGVKRLPSAATCSMDFYIPRGISEVEELRVLIMQSLIEGQGFSKI